MSRRGTNVLGLIAKSIFESTAGRIRWRHNMWAIIGSKWDKRRTTNTFGEIIREGHVLVYRTSVLCPYPPAPDFYFDGKWWHVVATECRKCEWHRAAGRNGFRFPRCTYRKSAEIGTVAAQTLIQLGGAVQKATEQAEEILKGNL